MDMESPVTASTENAAETVDYSKIDRLLEKSEREFSFLKPGGDDGQLPLRDLFSTLRDITADVPAFKAIHFCAAQATGSVERVLDSLRSWSEADLAEIRNLLDELRAFRDHPERTFTPPPADLAGIDETIEKVAGELALAKVGSDDGQFPLRDLVAKLRDKSRGNPALAQFHEAADFSTEFVQAVLESLEPWTADQLASLAGLLEQLRSLRQNPALSFARPKTAEPVHSFAAREAPIEAPVAVIAAAAAAESEIPLVFDAEADGELLREFISESQEHLLNIENGVLTLEENPEDKEELNSIFRAFHTFKGSSGFLNLVPINKCAHELENLLDLARQEKLAVTTPIINIILEGGDVLKQFVIEMQARIDGKKKPGPFVVPTSDLIGRVRQLARGEAVSAPAAAPKAAAAAAPISASPTETAASTPAAEATSASETASAAAAPKPAAARAPVVETPSGDHDSGKAAFIKVDTSKLDGLFDLVGEMVIAQSLVSQDPELRQVNSPRLTRNLAQLGRITGELQKTTMSMRMVPIRGTFQKMTRAVRDLSGKVNKQVNLVLSGEETELDRTIVEEIGDPLLHMVRNSVDHGIESTEKRVAAGKSPIGTVSLRAFHEGGNIVIELSDDGGGLNKERILQKARENGIVGATDTPTDSEIFQLIFAPGFSTAEKVTDISGRGVGMDVVRRNIQKLRGKIEIRSETGKGSTFTIFLPLTLAIIEGLVVRVGNQRYIIPTLSVRESLRPLPEMISTLHQTHEMVNVRGSLHPLIRLHEVFAVPNAIADATEAIVVMIEAGHYQAALLVDDLVGKQEVVIKSLGETFKGIRALAGAAILGDGAVGLILDTAALVHHTTNSKG